MRIGISTGGGDAPGLNAVIRAAVLSATGRGWEVIGIRKGFAGLLGEDQCVTLTRDSVRGIGHLGGTILRTTNHGNPFHYPVRQPDGPFIEVDRSAELFESVQRLGIDAIIAIGGDGTLEIARRLSECGLKIVGVPKTIDNDVGGTVTTFGFDTAVNTALDAIDKLHTTAESHDRVMVLEVMGRHAGFIALHAGLAGTADVILIPEIPYDIRRVCEKIVERDGAGRRFSIVVAAEGAFPRGVTSRRWGHRCRAKRNESVASRTRLHGRSRQSRERRRDRSCSAIFSVVASLRAMTVCSRRDSGVRLCERSRTGSGDVWLRSSPRTSSPFQLRRPWASQNGSTPTTTRFRRRGRPGSRSATDVGHN